MSENKINTLERLFLQSWRGLDFSEWNESDVREGFIAPLLSILRYARGTTHDVLTEKVLTLSEPYHRIGRKRVKIDYIPTVRLRRFWIIEAKPGSPREMDFGDFLQAHLYAIHPEVSARYIVLMNGWELRVYDAQSARSWDDYIILSNQENCFDTFPVVSDLLRADHLASALRDRIVKGLRTSLEVEVDERHANNLRRQVDEAVRAAIPTIRENARTLRVGAWRKESEAERQELRTEAFNSLLISMDIPTDQRLLPGSICAERILEADDYHRKEYIQQLLRTYRGSPHNVYRALTAYVLCRIMLEGIEVTSSPHVTSIRESLDEVIERNFSYCSAHPRMNALCHLDNTTLRVTKKAVLRFGVEKFRRVTEAQLQTLSDEDRVIYRPSVAQHMVSLIGFLAESLWRRWAFLESSDEIWRGIWLLENFEESLEQVPLPAYPDTDRDLLFFESYGRGADTLCTGTWNWVTCAMQDVDNFNAPESVQHVLRMNPDDVISRIPPSRPRHKELNFSDEQTRVLTDWLQVLGIRVQPH